jgi:hypothetical protein
MRRFTLASGAAAVALTIAIPMSAHAAGDTVRDERGDPTDVGDAVGDAVTDRVEALRLECAVRATDAGPAVGCKWTAPTSKHAVGIRLYRFDPATDPHRRVIFRTHDLEIIHYTDAEVRPGHRYAYAVQSLNELGRVVGQSRTEWVEVPKPPAVEVLLLACRLGRAHETIGCEWSRPESRDAYVVTLWRSVDGGARERVEQFRPSGPNAYRDPVPPGASEVTYTVIATSESDRPVARSRPETVRIPDVRPTDVRPTDVAPTDVRPSDVAPTDAAPAAALAALTATESRIVHRWNEFLDRLHRLIRELALL